MSTTDRRAPASTRRRTAGAVVVAMVAVVTALAALASACGAPSSNDTGLDDGPGERVEGAHAAPTLLPRRTFPTLPSLDETTDTSGPPRTDGGVPGSAPAASGPPYPVGVTQASFEDQTRSTPTRGSEPGKRGRTFATTIRYPASREGTDAPAAQGPFPLVIFVHGYRISAAPYGPMLDDLAAAGFVVAAPELPGTSDTLPGQPIETDVSQQPQDVSFLITELQAQADEAGPLEGVISSGKVGVVGHSDGGNTAAALAFNARNREPRVGAVVLLAAERNFFQSDTWFLQEGPAMPPMLGVHADTDEVTAFARGLGIYQDAPAPKWFITVKGGDHLSPFTDGPLQPTVTAPIIDFLNGKVRNDRSALDELAEHGNVAPLELRSQAS